MTLGWWSAWQDPPTHIKPEFEAKLAKAFPEMPAYQYDPVRKRIVPLILEDTNKEVSSPSTVTKIPPPTIKTQEEYDALPDGTLFLNAKGEERIK